MKNKEADTELESRLLEILVHPCRIEDIRRELPNAGKNNLKNALDALVADGRVMKNKKNRFAVSAHYGCAAGTYLATERAFAFVAPDYPEGEAKPDDLFIPLCGRTGSARSRVPPAGAPFRVPVQRTHP